MYSPPDASVCFRRRILYSAFVRTLRQCASLVSLPSMCRPLVPLAVARRADGGRHPQQAVAKSPTNPRGVGPNRGPRFKFRAKFWFGGVTMFSVLKFVVIFSEGRVLRTEADVP